MNKMILSLAIGASLAVGAEINAADAAQPGYEQRQKLGKDAQSALATAVREADRSASVGAKR